MMGPLGRQIEAGACSILQHRFDYDKLEHNIGIVGKFTVECELREQSEQCGGPFCEELWLSGQGYIYEVDAVAKNVPSFPQDLCTITGPPFGNSTRRGHQTWRSRRSVERAAASLSTHSSSNSKHGSSAAVATAAAAASTTYYGDNDDGHMTLPDNENWEVGFAYVHAGPMTITSTLHKTPYTTGFFQFVEDFDSLGPATAMDVATKIAVRPFKYDLKFVSPYEAPYYNRE